MMRDAARYQALYDSVMAWLEGHGISVAGVWAEHFNVGWLLHRRRRSPAAINTTMAFWLIALDLRRSSACWRSTISAARSRGSGNRNAARVILDGSAATAVKIRKYMLVRTQMSVVTGVLVGLFALVAGLQFAAEWGVIAFALNYIPFIGPFVATLFPTFWR